MNSICIKCNEATILDTLYEKIISLKNNKIVCRKHSFAKFDNIIIHFYSENINILYNHISKIISEIIIKYYEPILIKRYINLNYFYFSLKDKQLIVDEFNLLKEKHIYDYKYVFNAIFKSVNSFIYNNKTMVLSGFVDFRLNDYKKYLENILSESVNQYIVDKEYVTFVNLLKNYIDSKITKGDDKNDLYF